MYNLNLNFNNYINLHVWELIWTSLKLNRIINSTYLRDINYKWTFLYKNIESLFINLFVTWNEKKKIISNNLKFENDLKLLFMHWNESMIYHMDVDYRGNENNRFDNII